MTFSFSDWQDGQKPPKGWDAADAVADGWSKSDLDAFMRATAKPWSPPPADPPPAERSEPAPAPVAKPKPVVEARTTQQVQPESATVTELRTRKTVAADDNWMLGLVCNEEGKVKPGVTKNWSLFLENHPDMREVFAFDAFAMRIMLMRRPPWEQKAGEFKPRVLQDRDYSEAVMWLEANHMTPKFSNIQPVIQTVAERSSFDRLRDYLDGIKWDEKKRVETWLSYYLGVEDSPYARTVGLRWLVSSVARGLQPGCKVDTMPILEGPQGFKKSTALRVLYGDEFFTDELSDIGSKDAKMEMQGVWGLEVGEMHRFGAAETSAVKKFLSSQTDRFRPPYGRSIIEAPRRVVLLGTINPEGNGYLKDPTGARRFWPVTVGRLDVAALADDRDQLWAEAVQLYRAGAQWWVQEDEQQAVEAQQELRHDVDVWVDLIKPMLVTRNSIAQIEIIKELGIPAKDADWRHAGRIGRIMKKLGWVARRDRTAHDDRVVFHRPVSDAQAPEQEAMPW